MNRFSIAAVLVLVAGLSAGVTVYFTAVEPPPTAYVMIGDTAYAYDPATSKAYVGQLERFGGKTAVLFDDFNRWFASLWVGKALGITIGWISVAVALILFWLARGRRDESS
jgi:hypothetical protein